MLGDIINLGVGTPSSVPILILFGLNPNPELRDAAVFLLLGLYDPSLFLEGVSDSTLDIQGVHDDGLRLIGDV